MIVGRRPRDPVQTDEDTGRRGVQSCRNGRRMTQRPRTIAEDRARTWVVILGPSLAEHFAGQRDGALFAQLVMTVPAVLLIVSATLAGLIAERIGRRRVLVAALVLFVLAGTAGLYAPDATTLIASRLLLGLAGGAVLTSSLSLAGDFPEGGARERVLGFAGAGGAAGAIVALNAGGWLVDTAGWRGPS